MRKKPCKTQPAKKLPAKAPKKKVVAQLPVKRAPKKAPRKVRPVRWMVIELVDLTLGVGHKEAVANRRKVAESDVAAVRREWEQFQGFEVRVVDFETYKREHGFESMGIRTVTPSAIRSA